MSKNVKGLEKLIKTLEKIPKEFDAIVEAELESSARNVELEAKRRAPVGTPESTGIKGYIGGSLRASIKAYKDKPKTWIIASNTTGLAPYDKFVEFGTRFMKAQPFLYPSFFRQRGIFIKDLENLIDKKIKKL